MQAAALHTISHPEPGPVRKIPHLLIPRILFYLTRDGQHALTALIVQAAAKARKLEDRDIYPLKMKLVRLLHKKRLPVKKIRRHYSQSGQLTEIVNNVAAALAQADDITVTHYRIQMETPFPFPWKKSEFFDVFPETFLRKPRKIKPVPETVMNGNYDLIIFGYPVWYLTPALPVTSFLDAPEAKTLFSGTPVVTVIGCRNMWIMAKEKMKHRLKKLKANLTGSIALVDLHIR